MRGRGSKQGWEMVSTVGFQMLFFLECNQVERRQPINAHIQITENFSMNAEDVIHNLSITNVSLISLILLFVQVLMSLNAFCYLFIFV